jgi:sulfatase maturation enzyme AslB (radical SAM superfamily)
MAIIIFKAIEKCNSNCIYCNVIKKHQDVVMDMGLVETVFGRINEFLLANPSETVTFTWHGGEVCLLGEQYLQKAHEIQTRLCPATGGRIKHLVQSNLTLITQGLIDAFKQLGITQIGSSF